MADTWQVKCEVCGGSYEVQADSQEEAITMGKRAHEDGQKERMMFRCDTGPLMQVAFNLSSPVHPGAPRGW